jgi:hypothetical protein
MRRRSKPATRCCYRPIDSQTAANSGSSPRPTAASRRSCCRTNTDHAEAIVIECVIVPLVEKTDAKALR